MMSHKNLLSHWRRQTDVILDYGQSGHHIDQHSSDRRSISDPAENDKGQKAGEIFLRL